MSALTNLPHTTFQLRQFVNEVQRPQDQAHIVAPGQDVFEDTTSEDTTSGVTDVLRANPERTRLWSVRIIRISREVRRERVSTMLKQDASTGSG
jgi:hypothetical protein